MESKRTDAIRIIQQKLSGLDTNSYITELIKTKNSYTDKFLIWFAKALSAIKINKDTINRLKSFKKDTSIKTDDSNNETKIIGPQGEKQMFYSTLFELETEFKFSKNGYEVTPIKPKNKGKTPDFIARKGSIKIKVEVSITDLNDIKLTEGFDESVIKKILDRIIKKEQQSKDLIIIQNKSFFNYIIKKRNAVLSLKKELKKHKVNILILRGVDFGYFECLPESGITQQKIDAYSGIDGVKFIRNLNEIGTIDFWLIFYNHPSQFDNEVEDILNR